jgi:hypothetical protein
MALRPDTPETRMVPVAGRQFAERRLMRGVGAKERAVGNAWSRLTSRDRQRYGNQRNFADAMQQEANRRAIAAEEDREEMLRNKGREMAGKTSQPTTNYDSIVIKPETDRFIQNEVDKDMYPEGRPAPKNPATSLADAIRQGRIKDPSNVHAIRGLHYTDKEDKQSSDRGYDNADWQGYVDENASDEDKEQARLEKKRARLLTKQYQDESLARARMRGQLGNRTPNRIY